MYIYVYVFIEIIICIVIFKLGMFSICTLTTEPNVLQLHKGSASIAKPPLLNPPFKDKCGNISIHETLSYHVLL